MVLKNFRTTALCCAVVALLTGCSGLSDGLSSLGGLFGNKEKSTATPTNVSEPEGSAIGTPPPIRTLASARSTRRGLFGKKNVDPATNIQVNKYIWAAALDVLSFLPVETADPFTGVIITGYGTPPGGGRAYRATVFIQDPALDARSLNLALQSRNGPANAATTRAIEDAILTRARQLRVGDGRL